MSATRYERNECRSASRFHANGAQRSSAPNAELVVKYKLNQFSSSRFAAKVVRFASIRNPPCKPAFPRKPHVRVSVSPVYSGFVQYDGRANNSMNNDVMQAAMAIWAAKDIPARLQASQVAKLLNCSTDDVAILVSAGNLLGTRPAQTECSEILWLH